MKARVGLRRKKCFISADILWYNGRDQFLSGSVRCRAGKPGGGRQTTVSETAGNTTFIREVIQMQFKEGYSWKACYDEERELYTAGIWGFGSFLYEISKEIFDELQDGMDGASSIIGKGRKLYMNVCDRCGPPYTVVFDEDYQKLCPWAQVTASGQEWPTEMVDAVVEVLDSEKENREQRRKKRKEKEEAEPKP